MKIIYLYEKTRAATRKVRPLHGFSIRFRCKNIKTPWIRSSRHQKCWQLYIFWKLNYWRKLIQNNFPRIKSSYNANGVFLRHGLRLPYRLCVFVRFFCLNRLFLFCFSGLRSVSGNSCQHTSCATQEYAMFPVYL